MAASGQIIAWKLARVRGQEGRALPRGNMGHLLSCKIKIPWYRVTERFSLLHYSDFSPVVNGQNAPALARSCLELDRDSIDYLFLELGMKEEPLILEVGKTYETADGKGYKIIALGDDGLTALAWLRVGNRYAFHVWARRGGRHYTGNPYLRLVRQRESKSETADHVPDGRPLEVTPGRWLCRNGEIAVVAMVDKTKVWAAVGWVGDSVYSWKLDGRWCGQACQDWDLVSPCTTPQLKVGHRYRTKHGVEYQIAAESPGGKLFMAWDDQSTNVPIWDPAGRCLNWCEVFNLVQEVHDGKIDNDLDVA